MGRVASVEKVEEWTKRLARYEAANETVARFCHREGVSVPSFSAWKQKRGSALESRVGASPRFLPVQITSPAPSSARRETVVRLGRDIRIELGVREAFQADPTDGSLFLFVNKRRDRMKLLHFADGGFWLYYRLLEAGPFETLQPRGGSHASHLQLDATELAMRHSLSSSPCQTSPHFLSRNCSTCCVSRPSNSRCAPTPQATPETRRKPTGASASRRGCRGRARLGQARRDARRKNAAAGSDVGHRRAIEVHPAATVGGSDGPELFFEDYTGTILGDCWHGFGAIVAASEGAIERAACNSHARRKFDDATDYPDDRRKWMNWYQALFDIETRAKLLSDEERLKLRQSQSQAIGNALREELDAIDHRTQQVVLPKSELRKALPH